jgi:hypothetical protein
VSNETPNLYQRILAAQGEIGWVKKDGKNTAQGYNYATESGLVASIKQVLTKHGIAACCSCVGEPYQWQITRKDKGDINIVRVHLKCALVNVDNPSEREESEWWGDGMDTGDKGIYKAITGAEKYFLMKTFLIPTGDDPTPQNANPENDEPEEDAPPPPKPRKRTATEIVNGVKNIKTREELDKFNNWFDTNGKLYSEGDAMRIVAERDSKDAELSEEGL